MIAIITTILIITPTTIIIIELIHCLCTTPIITGLGESKLCRGGIEFWNVVIKPIYESPGSDSHLNDSESKLAVAQTKAYSKENREFFT